MSFTFTRNLRLRLSSGITADARYNLERLDTLLANYVPDSTDLYSIKARGNILLEPASTDLGGSGSDGELDVGTTGNALSSINLYSTDVKFSTRLSLKDQASSGTHYLKHKYKSDNDSDSVAAADYTLTYSLKGGNRSLSLGTDLAVVGPGTIRLRAAANSDLDLPVSGTLVTDSAAQTLTNKAISADSNTITGLTNANISGSAAIAGTKISPDFGSQAVSSQSSFRLVNGSYYVGLLPPNTLAGTVNFRLPNADGADGQVMVTDGSGNLGWTSVASDDLTSDGVPEGVTNLYFTSARARSTISAIGSLSYDSTTGVMSLSTLSTTNITEGTNLYYTDARARLAISGSGSITYDNSTGAIGLSTLSTTNVTEGSNLYFTDERAQDAVGSILTDTASIDFTYNDAGGAISAVVLPAGVAHDSLSGYDANKHIDHTGVTISGATNGGLSGGGTIASSRTLSLDPSNTTAKASPVGADTVLIGDSASSFALKSSTVTSILSLVPSTYGFAANWVTADSTSKTVTHSLGTKDVMVQIYDKATDGTILVDSIVRTDTNTVTLTSSSAPNASGWRVLVYRVN